MSDSTPDRRALPLRTITRTPDEKVRTRAVLGRLRAQARGATARQREQQTVYDGALHALALACCAADRATLPPAVLAYLDKVTLAAQHVATARAEASRLREREDAIMSGEATLADVEALDATLPAER